MRFTPVFRRAEPHPLVFGRPKVSSRCLGPYLPVRWTVWPKAPGTNFRSLQVADFRPLQMGFGPFDYLPEPPMASNIYPSSFRTVL